jgi:hypothetical protein
VLGLDGTTEASRSHLFDELTDLLNDKFNLNMDNKIHYQPHVIEHLQYLVPDLTRESKPKKKVLQIETTSSRNLRPDSPKLQKAIYSCTPMGSPRTEASRITPRSILDKLKNNLQAALDKGKSPVVSPTCINSARLMQAARSSGNLLTTYPSQKFFKSNTLQQSGLLSQEKVANLEVLRKVNIHILDRYVRSEVTPQKASPRPVPQEVEASPRKKINKHFEAKAGIYSSQTYQTTGRRLNSNHKRSDMRLSIGIADTRHSMNITKDKASQQMTTSSTEKRLELYNKPQGNNPRTGITARQSNDGSKSTGKDSIDLQRLFQMKKKLNMITKKKKHIPATVNNVSTYITIDDVLQDTRSKMVKKPFTLGSIPQQIDMELQSPKKSERNLNSPSSGQKQENIKKITLSFWEKAAATKHKFGLK